MDKKFWANLVLCIVLGGFFAVAVTNVSSALTPKGLFVTDPRPEPEVAALLPEVDLVDYKLVEGPGPMVHAEFIVSNNSDKDLKNINILCELFDPDEKYLDRETWLLSEKIPAGKTIPHSSVSKRIIHSRSSGMQCSLVDFDIVEEPLFVLHRSSGGHGDSAEDAGHGPQTHGMPAGH